MIKSRFCLIDTYNDLEAEEEELEEQIPEPEVDEKEGIEYRALNKSEVSVRLSWLGKTPEGDGYTYLKATLTGMMLTNIMAIRCFKLLQFVDLSDNLIFIEELQEITKLPYLLLLHADRNKLHSADLHKCKYLQVIIMNNNQIASVEHVFQPELRTLEVGYNKVSEIKFINRMENLRVLDFRYNLIHNVLDLDFPNLDSLYLAGNKIKDVTGITRLQNLRVLHLRYNPLRFLNGFDADLPKLKYLNLRSCKIHTHKQVKRLRILSNLETLVMNNTPYMGGTGKEGPDADQGAEDQEIRVEIAATLPLLKRLNKDFFSPDEKAEAKELMARWATEGETVDEEEMIEEEEHPEDAEGRE